MAHGARERRFERRPSGGGFQAGGDAGLGVVSQALAQAGNVVTQIAGGQIDKHVRAESAQVTADLSVGIERLALENEDDPVAFFEIAGGFSAGALDAVHPRHAAELQAFSDQLIGRHHNRLLRRDQLRQDDENRAKTNAGVNAARREVAWAARNFNPDDPDSVETLERARGRVVELLADATEGDAGERPYISDVQATNELIRMDAEVAEEKAWGGFERARGVGQDDAFLSEFSGAGDKRGLTTAQHRALTNRMKADISSRKTVARAEAAALKAERAAASKLLRDDAKDREELLDGGVLPKSKAEREEILGVALELYRDGQSREAEDLLISMRTSGTAREIRTSPLAEAEAQAGATLSKTPTGRLDIATHKTTRTAIERHRAGLTGSDPTGYVRGLGIGGDVGELDVSDPDVFGQSLVTRKQAAAAQSDMYEQAFSALSASDAAITAQHLEGLPAADQLPYLAVLDSRLGADAGLVFEQLDKHNPIFGVAGGIAADGRPDVAEAVLRGQEAIKAGLVMRPPRADILTASEEALGDLYRQSGFEAHRERIQDAALAHYASKVQGSEQGSGAVFLPDVYRQSLNEVTGGVIDWSPGFFTGTRSMIEAPFPGAVESDVVDWIESLDGTTIDGFGGVAGVPSEDVSELIMDHGALRSTGSGRYAVQIGATYLQTPEGELFELRFGGR